MKLAIPLLAAVVAALVIFRPAASPPIASAWTSAAPAGRHGARPAAAPDGLVYVAGAVAHPGVYELRPDARVRDAVRLAGGIRADADPVGVNLAAHLRDGDEIVVPVRGAEALAGGLSPKRSRAHRRRRGGAGYDRSAGELGIVSDSSSGGGRSSGGRRGAHGGRRGRKASFDAAPPATPIDLNAADAKTLGTVPGIGPGLAIRIVAFREANGPFASTDELLDVAGITDRRLDAILPYVVAR